MAHVAATVRRLSEMVVSQPPPGGRADLAQLFADINQRMSDTTEDHPAKLGALVQDAVEDLVEACAERPGDEAVDFVGCPTTVAALCGHVLSELVLHGYDIAYAIGCPWPIDPLEACLCMGGLTPLLPLVVDADRARGHTAGYAVQLRGGPGVTVRFTDGTLTLEAPGGPVDATISADPVAWLLVANQRLSRYEAFALGLLHASGRRPDLAVAFPDLFVHP